MKVFIAAALSLFAMAASQGQSSLGQIKSNGTGTQGAGSWTITESGADYNVWHKTTYETGPDGVQHSITHSVTELATGLNHTVGSAWVASKEKINILPNGSALATGAGHQAYFPSDIYDGAIKLVTDSGTVLQSRPIGLFYDDGTNTVMIAELTNSIGYIVGSNQVVYPNAFVGVNADLRYTYTRAGFEQDIILKSQPLLAPEELQMDSRNTQIQLLTEFFNPPTPTVRAAATPVQGDMALSDECLSFGDMQMIQGRAYLMGNDGHDAGAWVSKSWLNIEGRQILVEAVPVTALADELLQLPQNISARVPKGSVLNVVSTKRLLPAQRLATIPSKQSIQMVQAARPAKGLVLDYNTVTGSLTNYNFNADMTYYVSGPLNLYGTNTFEGGTVIKYASGASITELATPLTPRVIFKSAAYRPVVFTAVDDNSVGSTISSSTGNPSGYYANPALGISSAGSQQFSNFRISYAQTALSASGTSLTNYNVQLVGCATGISISGSNAFVGNGLFLNVNTNFILGTGAAVVGQNVTFNGASVMAPSFPTGTYIALTNCILANVTNDSGTIYAGTSGFYDTPTIGSGPITIAYYPFTTVGEGGNYLTNGCAFINAGTPNLDSTLLTLLQAKTIYPPAVVYSDVLITNSLSLYPLVQRENINTPSLGYHYDPIDYGIGWIETTNVITINPGTVVGLFSPGTPEYGIGVAGGGQLLCQGLANNLVRMVEYSAVQEEQGTNWVTPMYLVCDSFAGTPVPVIVSKFTDWSEMAQDAPLLYLSSASTSDYLQNSQFHGGLVDVYYQSVNVTNCLFERTDVEYAAQDGGVPCLENNMFWNGTFYLRSTATNTLVQDNLFDQTIIPVNTGKGGRSYQTISANFNAYVTNYNRLQPPASNDLVLANSPAYQAGTLGNYYIPSNSPLINRGHTNANYVGLYHFTIQTNQVPETNSAVDIGYHYVATDLYGNPLDVNADGVPDYLEDANGNGLVDNGETNWALAILEQPLSQMVLQGSNAIFSVTAGGIAPIGYQWYSNGANLTGATNSSLVVTNVQISSGTNYYVVVSNYSGNITSTVATLTLTVDWLINVDFGSQTNSGKIGYAEMGDATNDFWNGYASQGQPTGILRGLKTAENYATTVGLLVTNLPSVGTNGSPDVMYHDFLYTNSSAATLTLTNLPSGLWNICLYSDDGNFGLSVGGTTYSNQMCFDSPVSTPLAWQGGVQYVEFAYVPVTNGQPLIITIYPGTNGAAVISGLQIATVNHTPTQTNGNPMTDSDYDGISDFNEMVDRTNPKDGNSVLPVRLGYWLFSDTNAWTGSMGQLPLIVTNVVGAPALGTNGLHVDSTNSAILSYRDIETNGNANINLRCGTIQFWFKPDWSSVIAGGSGPGVSGRLIEMGYYNPISSTNGGGATFTNGWWALYLSPDGDQISFGSSTNGAGAVNLTAAIAWAANGWHQVALTYTRTNSLLYLDGQFVTNGAGSLYYPNLAERAGGFRVGSDQGGNNQAAGTFAQLQTFNYALSPDEITNSADGNESQGYGIGYGGGSSGSGGNSGGSCIGYPTIIIDSIPNFWEFYATPEPGLTNEIVSASTTVGENPGTYHTVTYLGSGCMPIPGPEETWTMTSTIFWSVDFLAPLLTHIANGSVSLPGGGTVPTSIVTAQPGEAQIAMSGAAIGKPSGSSITYSLNIAPFEIPLTILTRERLAYLSFDTGSLVGNGGQLPTIENNVIVVFSPFGNGISFTSSSEKLAYAAFQNDNFFVTNHDGAIIPSTGSPNIRCNEGTIRFWFQPGWSSGSESVDGYFVQTLGGSGLTLQTTNNGTKIKLTSEGTANLAATVNLVNGQWYQISVSYSPTATFLYTNGVLVGQSGGVAQTSTGATAFLIGNDGTSHSVNGIMDEVETFNYPLAASDVLAAYQAACAIDADGDGIPDLQEFEMGIDPSNPPGGNDHYPPNPTETSPPTIQLTDPNNSVQQ